MTFDGRLWLAGLALFGAYGGFNSAAQAQTGEPTPKPNYSHAQTKALGEWSETLALQAASWGAPAVVMYDLRYDDAVGPKPKATPNQIFRMEIISTPEEAAKSGYVSPNVNTLYGFGFLDLGPEPVIMSMPDSEGRYYMVETLDFWSNAFAYPAGHTTGYKGGKVAFVGPGWKGELPADLKRIDCATRWILIQPRIHVTGQADLPGADKVLNAITTQGLSAYLGKPALPKPNYSYLVPKIAPNKTTSDMVFDDPLQFWEILSAAMNENPPPEGEIKALLPMFAPLGLELGKQWDRSKVDPVVLTAMRQAVLKLPDTLLNLPYGALIKGWLVAPIQGLGDWGTNYFGRAYASRIGFTWNQPYEAYYLMGYNDVDERPLTGAEKYTITWKQIPGVDQPGFWSLTPYDLKTSYTVPNPIKRYSLGSDNKDLKYNPDGSFTLYLQADNPGTDKESNWLPTGKGPFYTVFRYYAPSEATMNAVRDLKTFDPPGPVVVK